MQPTNTADFFETLNAGVFSEQIGRALSDVAAGVVDHGKKGKVVITLELAQIGEGAQVKIAHTLAYTQPTLRGKRSEDTTLNTTMYVSPSGLHPYPTDPTQDLFAIAPAAHN